MEQEALPAAAPATRKSNEWQWRILSESKDALVDDFKLVYSSLFLVRLSPLPSGARVGLPNTD
jgi:hypothetical protein